VNVLTGIVRLEAPEYVASATDIVTRRIAITSEHIDASVRVCPPPPLRGYGETAIA
jgi:hypothetical protein